MPYGWRIVKQRLASTAFDGEGARLFGGRWNSPGERMVYTASSRSLATLEIVVHVANTELLDSYVILSIEFPEKFVTELDIAQLPPNWRMSPAPVRLQEIGDDWLASKGSAIFAVPSAIIPEERNYLINPSHPDISRLDWSKPLIFAFDGRLVRR